MASSTDRPLIYASVLPRAAGNDLRTPSPEFGFPGLKPGDKWFLCALRWREALDEGVAPPVIMEATHESALRCVAIEDLKGHALDAG